MWRLRTAHRPWVPVSGQRAGHRLNRHHMVGSMGRVGAAGGNAAMESFLGAHPL